MFLRYAISPIIALLVTNIFGLDLKPITDIEQLTGVRTATKRDASFTGDLDLQDFESFFWGAPAGNNLVYANLTVYFPEQYEHVIAMERFANKLKSVQCAEDMMLEFIDEAAFTYAKNVWNWVNQDVNNSFIMVTNYEGCADDMERLPFVVSNIRYDEENNKAHLTADLKEWEEIAHSYDLNVGHMPLTPNHRMLMERGVMPRGADFSMNLVSGYDKNLFSTTVGGWTSSVDAVVRTVGSLNVDFDVSVKWLALKSAAMTISPENVAASIQLALTEKGTLKKEFNWQKTIVSIPIEGISIAKIVKLGAFLDVDVGFTMEEWTGTATANFGARMALSNAAVVKVDLVNSKNNKFSGWTPSFTPIPLTLSAKIEGSAEVYAEPNVKLEASALGKGWNVALNMKMPYIQADFAAMYDSTGVCDSKKTLGVDIDANVGVELNVAAATKGHEGSPFWEQSLYSHEWPLFSKCLAFGPKNAKSGEKADPNPKSKKPKSKKPKKTKKPKSKKPKATPKPKSTKAKVTKKPKTTKKPEPSIVSKKAPKTTPKPSKVASKTEKPAKKTTKATDEPARATSKPVKSTNLGSSKKTRSTSDDAFSSKSYTSSQGTLPASTTSLITGTGIPDSSPVPEKPTGNPLTTSVAPVETGEPETSFYDRRTRRSRSTAATPTPTITTGPSTISTATSTSSSLSSTSTSPPDTCPMYGCRDCKDVSADFINADDVPSRLRKRFDTRTYEYICKDTSTAITSTVTMASYPQFADLAKAAITTSFDFYQAATTTKDCLNHKVTTTAVAAGASGLGSPGFSMEHIYEGHWVVHFLNYLHDTAKVSCEDMASVFWSPTTTNNAGRNWVQAIMESLGSTVHQDQLVFLRQDINGAKNRIFESTTAIIARNKIDKGVPIPLRLARMAVVGRAIDYMAQHDVGLKLEKTAKNVEDTLAALAQSPIAKQKLGALANKDELSKLHRAWLHDFMSTGNADAIHSMKDWAKSVSKEIDPVTRTQGHVHTEPTLAFLQALQASPPTGFDASVYAPLLP